MNEGAPRPQPKNLSARDEQWCTQLGRMVAINEYASRWLPKTPDAVLRVSFDEEGPDGAVTHQTDRAIDQHVILGLRRAIYTRIEDLKEAGHEDMARYTVDQIRGQANEGFDTEPPPAIDADEPPFA